MTNLKKCYKCNLEKDIGEFKRGNLCLTCLRIYNYEYKKQNKIEKDLKWKLENPNHPEGFDKRLKIIEENGNLYRICGNCNIKKELILFKKKIGNSCRECENKKDNKRRRLKTLQKIEKWKEENPGKEPSRQKEFQENGILYRFCYRCNVKKESKEFRKGNICILCAREKDIEYGKKRYLKNKDKVILRNKIWRKDNIESYKKYIQNYEKENKEKLKEIRKEWRLQNIDHCRKIANENVKNRRKNDINFKLSTVLRKRIYNALIIGKGKKSDKTLNLLGCTLSEFKNHIEKQFKDGMTWQNYGKFSWHIDHIKPCSVFDLKDPEEQKKCFHYSNMQPLWAEENWSKGDKY